MNLELPASACVLVVHEGKVLSVSRKNDDSSFALPGGKVEPNEDLKTAAARECFEETGTVVGGLQFLYEAECDGYWCTAFLATQFFGQARDMGEDMVSWVYPEQLLGGAYSSYNRHVIAAYNRVRYRF